jgi:NADH dehydrogenase
VRVISVFGGSGFLGSKLIKSLEDKAVKIRLFTRNKLKVKFLKPSPKFEIIEINNKVNLEEVLDGSDIIIDLIGILHESKKSSFDKIHAKRLKKIAKIASSSGVKRFIHVGALGSSINAPSKYLQSKAKGEKYIKKECINCSWTIFKPSIIFGKEDKFINLFYKIIKYLPVVLLISPYAKFQPIFVNDVVDIIIKSIDDKKTFNKSYDLGGPKIYSFLEILKLVAYWQKRNIWILPLGKRISYIMVRILECLPLKIITRDNLKSMSIDNTTKINDAYQFKERLKTLSEYLATKSSKG